MNAIPHEVHQELSKAVLARSMREIVVRESPMQGGSAGTLAGELPVELFAGKGASANLCPRLRETISFASGKSLPRTDVVR